jgi:rfaE bifunctional protein kinase chain/domain
LDSIKKTRAEEILNNCQGKTVAVIGDVMLDKYYNGTVGRISPEAPVPVIDLQETKYHLGGAANVAKNLQRLGMNTLLCGCLGDDNDARIFKDLTAENGIDGEGLFNDKNRPTTVKTRIIGNNQQIARVDKESRLQTKKDCYDHIFSVIKKADNLSAIVFGDYDKGVIGEHLIKDVTEYAKERNIPIFVDPKYDYFFQYKDVTLFKPNKKEAAEALDMLLYNFSKVKGAGKALIEKLNCEYVLITLGAQGMMLIDKSYETFHIQATARNVADVSGAGDTAIAVMAASYVGGGDMKEAAMLANYASGVVILEPGIVAIEPTTLLENIPE